MNIDDEATASDEEIVAAYVADGYDEEQAGVMLAALRGRLPGTVD